MINTLDCLYGSLLDAGKFDVFLKRFAEIAAADSAALFDFDLSRPHVLRFTTSAYDDATHARFIAAFPTIEDKLWWERSERQMTAGSVINGIDLASEHEIKATRYYRELLQPLDILHSAGVCGVMRQDAQCLLTINRSERRGPFGDDSMDILRAFAPHWVRYKQLEQRLAAGQRDLRGHRGLAVFELGVAFDVRRMNGPAEHCLAEGWLQRGPDSVLRMHDARSQSLWATCQRHAAATSNTCTVPVYGHHAEVVAYAALQPIVDTSLTPRRLLFVRPLQPTGNHGDLAATLRLSCGLTVSEANFAVALRRSETLADAAQVLGITVGTARQRLQEIFEKMDLHRQTELFQALDALAELNDHLYHRAEQPLH
ncbi:helix-turn-helix transcriptional regulator [Solilutibacter silvestris]|uniref:helix-turn-helix transcriptional regulator n=1 Tax=Solilutibacter silvestris TaxID=1645665 RepID=UPI000CA06720|nr:hypothetical protein [Lysobacter silvestris]